MGRFRRDLRAPPVEHLELLPDDVAAYVLDELQELDRGLLAKWAEHDDPDRVLALPWAGLEFGERAR